MTFLYRGQTEQEVIHALYILMYQPLTRGTRIWLLASGFEVILTFFVCSIMVIRKKTLGKLWIITRRLSHYGTFFVSNAIFVLALVVAAYLLAWDLTAIVIVTFSFARLPSMGWW